MSEIEFLTKTNRFIRHWVVSTKAIFECAYKPEFLYPAFIVGGAFLGSVALSKLSVGPLLLLCFSLSMYFGYGNENGLQVNEFVKNLFTRKLHQDYILLIMNCNKYRYKAEKQLKTWLPTIPSTIVYFHVLGDPECATPFCFDYEKRILWVKTNDDYNSLPHKVISAYEAVEKTYNYKYILKTDDDQQLSDPGFFKMLMRSLDESKCKIHYGGHIVNVDTPHISKYYLFHPELPRNLLINATKYCNGRFYLLSKEATQYLLSKKKFIQKEYLEDYAIGFYLHSNFKQPIFYIDSKKYFHD